MATGLPPRSRSVAEGDRPRSVFRTTNPATEEVLEELTFHSGSEVAIALSEAEQAFAAWRRTPIEARGAVLRRAAELLRGDGDELARHAVHEMGKPIVEARAEVTKCARTCDWFAENAPRLLADEPIAADDADESWVVYDPLGVVLAIMPWNFPYWQVFRAAAPTLMAGNAIVLKHALNVSRCALEIERIFTRAGAPRGLFRTLLVPHDRVPSLIGSDVVVAATLTGSERAGTSVAREAGAALKKTVLELGGSDAFIVLADADLDGAAKTAVASRFQNAGQSCIAAKRFFVEASVEAAFTSRFLHHVRELRLGDPMDPSTQVGPLARADLRDEIERQVRETLAMGARVLAGAKRAERAGWFYEPTVLVDVPAGSPALEEETFGPLAPIVTVKDADEAIRRANASRFGLGGNLWTRDLDRARRLARELTSGSVFINGMTASDPRRPFGGIKKSGYGRELGAHGIRELVNVKTMWIGRTR
jgi:succinate-semialdehyde dehydrogenase/glutarate-semialdehyde dehydrogenase